MNEIAWLTVAVVALALLATLVVLLVMLLGRLKGPAGMLAPEIAAPVPETASPIDEPGTDTEIEDQPDETSAYSEDDCLRAFNAMIEAKTAFDAATDEIETGDAAQAIEQFELVASVCTASGLELKLCVLPTVHPQICRLAGEFVVFFEDFSIVAVDWVAVLGNHEVQKQGTGIVDFMVQFAVNSLAGDPLLQTRERAAREEGMSENDAQLGQRMKILWMRYHALATALNQHGGRWTESFGWVDENTSAGRADA
jgi:hypothetical protein